MASPLPVAVEDVQRLLPNETIPSEAFPTVEGLIEEAIDLVEAYCRQSFDGDMPGKVRRVVARMVARVWSSDDGNGGDLPVGASNVQFSAGPFAQTVGFEAGATSSGVWLSASDKQRLSAWRGRVFTVWPY